MFVFEFCQLGEQFETLGREPVGTLKVTLTRAPSIKRHSSGTPESSARTDADVKTLNKTIARISGQMVRLEEIALNLVKKNNSDSDISAERERTMKLALRAANKTILILRTSCADKHLLDLLIPEEVPQSTTKLPHLDKSSYIKGKMATRQATAVNAAPFGVLLEATAEE